LKTEKPVLLPVYNDHCCICINY